MFILSLLADPIKALGFLAGLLLAVTVHEFMHGWTADKLGDPTARMMGRVTLDPFKHLDIWGTLLFLWVGFGWGKPVLINPANFKNPRQGEILSSLAGPFSNLATAFLFSLPLRFFPESGLAPFFVLIIEINLILCVFNLLPIPPLDGSRLLWAIFPGINLAAFEQTGMTIIFGLFFLSYLTGYSIIGAIIWPVVSFLANLLGVPISV